MTTVDKYKALIDATKDGRIEDVKMYLNDDTVDVNCKEIDGWTSLHNSCDHGHLEIAELLLNHGADIEGRTDRFSTPLLLACAKGHLSIVKLLLDRGANIDACDNQGCNPLHGACLYRHVSILKLLLDRGCAINAVDWDGDTPLHIACNESYTDCVAELLAHGADVTVQNKDGRACNIGVKNCVTELLAHGADVTVKNNDGQTPMNVAQSRKQQSIIDLLLNSERDNRQRLHDTYSVRGAKDSIMVEMKDLTGEVEKCIAKVSSMENVKESVVAEMKAEISAMEERLDTRLEALSNRQCDKRLIREETEMNQQPAKRPRIKSTLPDRGAPQVAVGEKEDTPMRDGKGTMFSMFNPFRKT